MEAEAPQAPFQTKCQQEQARLRSIDCRVEVARGRSLHPSGVFHGTSVGGNTDWFWIDKQSQWRRVPSYTQSRKAMLDLIGDGLETFGAFACEECPDHPANWFVRFGMTGTLGCVRGRAEAVCTAYLMASEFYGMPKRDESIIETETAEKGEGA